MKRLQLLFLAFFFLVVLSCRKELLYTIDDVQYIREYERPGVVIDDSTTKLLQNYLKQINNNDSNDFKVQFVHKWFNSDGWANQLYVCGYIVNNGFRVYPYIFEWSGGDCFECNTFSFSQFFPYSESALPYRCNLRGVKLDTVAHLSEKEVIKTFLDTMLASDMTTEDKQQNLQDTIRIKFGYYAMPDTSNNPVTLIKCWRLKTNSYTKCVALISDSDNTILSFTPIYFRDERDITVLEGY